MSSANLVTAEQCPLTNSGIEEIMAPLDTIPSEADGFDFTSLLGALGEAYSRKLNTLRQAEKQAISKFHEAYKEYVNLKCGVKDIPKRTNINISSTHVLNEPNSERKEAKSRARYCENEVEESLSSSTPYKHLSKIFPDVYEISSSRELWQKKITVPEPFDMTIRDEEFPKKRSPSLDSDTIPPCFHSNPVPAHVHLPMYQLITEQSEVLRQERINNHKQKLLAQVKPFNLSFSSRPGSQNLVRSQSLTNLPTQSTKFIASPFPKHLFKKSTKNEQEILENLRQVRIKTRSEEMMKQSSLPFSIKKPLHHWNSSGSLCSGQPAQKSLLVSKPSKQESTEAIQNLKSNRENRHINCIPNYQKQSTDMHRMYASPQHKPVYYRTTKTTQLRCVKNLKDQDMAKQQEELEQAQKSTRKAVQMQLQREVSIKIKMHNQIPCSQKTIREKLSSHRRSQQSRLEDYSREMQDMRERLKKRPLLIEQQVQQASRDAALRRVQSGKANPYFVDQLSNIEGSVELNSVDQSQGSDSDTGNDFRSTREDGNEDSSEVETSQVSYHHSLAQDDAE